MSGLNAIQPAGVVPYRFRQVCGIFFSYLGMPDIERTTIQFPEGNGEQVSANSFATGISYARELTDRFSIGGNLKYIRENIWHSSASTFAFDIGLLYRTIFKFDDF